MPKFSEEMEEKIIELIEQGDKNAEISRKLGIDRGAVSKRRKTHLNRKFDQQKPEMEPEKTIQQEQKESHTLDPQIYTLIRYQGTHSQEEALSQAIETQRSFNPYILNHGLKTPKELIKFFEDKSQRESTPSLLEKRISKLEEMGKELLESAERRLKDDDACKHVDKNGFCHLYYFSYDEVDKAEYLRSSGRSTHNGKTVYLINVRDYPLICSACPDYEPMS